MADAAAGARIDSGVLYGLPTLDDYIMGTRRVPRALAMTCPPVKMARDVIAGSLGGLAMELVNDATGEPLAGGWSLLDQPEADRAASVTWTNVAEDMLFDEVAVLGITHTGWHGRPAEVVRLDPSTWTAQPQQRVFKTATGSGTYLVHQADSGIIRIESPNPGLLTAGAQAIRTYVALAAMTSRVAAGLPPATYFTPKDGHDVLSQEEIQALLDNWFQARQKNVTGYVPGALELKALGWNPEQLQMSEMKKEAILDIARIAGLDGERFSVSTTSRTYFNAWDRKQDFIQFVDGPYLKALAGRLSMPDVTPRGYVVRHKLDDFYQADTLARFQAYDVALRTGAMTIEEIRIAEKKPALTAQQIADVVARSKPAAPAATSDVAAAPEEETANA
jgi:hypothetical protein